MADDADEQRRRIKVYEETGNDAEAAERLGVSSDSFRRWRKKHGLPARFPWRLTEEDEAHRYAIYEVVTTDAQAAHLLGLNLNTWVDWRRRRALAAPGCVQELPAAEEDRRHLVYEMADTDAHAAQLLGLPEHTFASWRKNRRLASKYLPERRWGLSREDFLQAWSTADTAAQAADALGIPDYVMRDWISREGIGLPAVARAAFRDGLSARQLRMWDAYCSSLSDREAGNKVNCGPMAFAAWRRRTGLPRRTATKLYWATVKRAAAAGNPVARHYVKQRFPRTGGFE